MTKLQRVIGLLAAFVVAIGLSACGMDNGVEGTNTPSTEVHEFTLTTNDGTQVPCVRVTGLRGFDCNWDKAVRSNSPKP